MIDEASQSGMKPEAMKPPDEDYFQAADDGLSLTPDEVKGRDAWFVWTGGNDRFWNQLTQTSGGAFDLLRVVSSHPKIDFLMQVLHTARPGTVDMSLLMTDNINNPRAMSPLYAIGTRLRVAKNLGRETLAGGAVENKRLNDFGALQGSMNDLFQPPDTVWTPHLLADGSDSAGLLASIGRFYLNIGTFSEETSLHGRLLVGGSQASPVQIRVLQQYSTYWQATVAQTANIAQFMIKASGPHRLQNASGEGAYLRPDAKVLERGRAVFAERCARCHSSKIPQSPPGLDLGSCAGSRYLDCWNRYWTWTKSDAFKQAMRGIVAASDFLDGNYLSTDMRVPVTLLETNACSALASNSITDAVWDNFSSQSYKNMPVRRLDHGSRSDQWPGARISDAGGRPRLFTSAVIARDLVECAFSAQQFGRPLPADSIS